MRYRAEVRSHQHPGRWMNASSCHHYRWWMKPFTYYSVAVRDTTTGEVVDSDDGYGSLTDAITDAHRRIARAEADS